MSTRSLALLADEPGLGKSTQLVVAADLVAATNILIVCPASMRLVWREEVKLSSLFGHRIHVMLHETDRPIAGCVNIINYDLLSRSFLMPEKFSDPKYAPGPLMLALCDIEWDVMILDESHLLKELESLRTMAVLGQFNEAGVKLLAAHCKRIWMSTGTPMPNHPGELFTTLTSMGVNSLNYKHFCERYCTFGAKTYDNDPKAKYKKKYDRMKPSGATKDQALLYELHSKLGSIMMRRFKQFVMPELPPIDVVDFPVPKVDVSMKIFFEEALADPKIAQQKIREQEEFARQCWERMIASGGGMNNMDMINLLEDLAPAVSMYRRWLGAIKAASLLPIIQEELESRAYHKIVIFAHHKQVITYLRHGLRNYQPVHIDGSVGPSQRQNAIEKFQGDDKVRVFIGQTLAAGVGITLTAASEVLQVEPDWVPANNAQAIMRCHRIGQRFHVRARMARLADTLDDYISAVLTRKTADICKVVDNK